MLIEVMGTPRAYLRRAPWYQPAGRRGLQAVAQIGNGGPLDLLRPGGQFHEDAPGLHVRVAPTRPRHKPDRSEGGHVGPYGALWGIRDS